MTDKLATKANKEALKITLKPKEEEWLEEEEMASVMKCLESDNGTLKRKVKKNPTEAQERKRRGKDNRTVAKWTSGGHEGKRGKNNQVT